MLHRTFVSSRFSPRCLLSPPPPREKRTGGSGAPQTMLAPEPSFFRPKKTNWGDTGAKGRSLLSPLWRVMNIYSKCFTYWCCPKLWYPHTPSESTKKRSRNWARCSPKIFSFSNKMGSVFSLFFELIQKGRGESGANKFWATPVVKNAIFYVNPIEARIFCSRRIVS